MRLSWIAPLIGLSLLGLSELGLSDPAWAGKLIYWKFNTALGRVELITDDGVQPTAMLLANPARVVIDLPNTSVAKSKQRIRKNLTKYVREVRVKQFDRETTRFVIELAPQVTVAPSDVKVRNLSPSRWFVQLPNFLPINTVSPQATPSVAIDVPPAGGTGESRRGQGIKLPPPRPPIAANPEDGPPTPSPDVSPPPSQPASAPSTPIRRGSIVVAIDPGHGGRDPGAVGINGLQEKVVVLSVGTQVAELLRKKGVNAVLTRSSDREIDLEPRVAMAARVKADVFVSIHANAISMSRPDINGLESYYYASAKGYKLARSIHNRILSATNVRDRGIRQARFYVVRRTTMPAVLLELGFVTGREDAVRLASASHRTKLAEAIAQGILDYFK